MNNPLRMIQQYMGMINGNPLLSNVMNRLRSGDTKGAETIARNFMTSQGKDFDEEFRRFKSSMHMR